MKVRWNSLKGSLKETEFLKKLEFGQLSKQIEILSTFLPDEILKIPLLQGNVHHFVGVLLFADVSGFTALCEKYNKTGRGGIYRLTATLNYYIGVLVEVIYFYGGDVLKFSGDAFLALWKADPNVCLFIVIHNVIECALKIQQTVGQFETEVNVLLKVKLSISCGNISFYVIGNESNKNYIFLGSAINDVKSAEQTSQSGDVVIAPTAWGHVSEDAYEVTYGEGGHVKVWRCLYKPDEKSKRKEYEQKSETVQKYCDKHVQHRNALHKSRKFDNTLTDSKITEDFILSLPPRPCLQIATQQWAIDDLLPFIIKPVQDQIDGRQPLKYLTEMRELTIQFINIIPTENILSNLFVMVDNAYQIVCNVVSKVLGVVNKVTLFDKDIVILVLFGLRGIKHELESQNALKSGYNIHNLVSRLEGVKSVSVSITYGLVYSGVVGHPFRREYTVIGDSVNKAARMMCAYVQKTTCDFRTYKNSKLSSYYFHLQPPLKLKGIEDAGSIFEYSEQFEEIIAHKKPDLPFIGRDNERLFIRDIIHRPEDVDEYYGVCVYGKCNIGKTALLRNFLQDYKDEGSFVVSLLLCKTSQRPYFCIANIYKQLYDANATLSFTNVSLVENVPPDLWNFNEILQKNNPNYWNMAIINRNDKMLNTFKEMVQINKKKCIVVIDNFQYIDMQSFGILEKVLNDKLIRLVCAGYFEEDSWDIKWKLSLNEHIKMIELEPLSWDEVSVLVCHLLDVDAVPIKLLELLVKSCDGRPGWIQSCLLRLVNNGGIQIKFMVNEKVHRKSYKFADPKYLQSKRNTEIQKTIISIAELSEKYIDNEHITLAQISLDLFDSFTPYQQLIIKTGAILGDVFTRTAVVYILKYPNIETFATAIKYLYEEEVFDCGSTYLNTEGFIGKNIACCCYFTEEELDLTTKYTLPKYAFCKILHFKNRNLPSVVYELIPLNQRKELHLKMTDVLENQNNSCPTCLRDNYVGIIKLTTFKEIMQQCNDLNNVYTRKLFSATCSNSRTEIKDIIRQTVKGSGNIKNLSDDEKIERPMGKIWEPKICFCLEILTKVYSDLIYHSDLAGHLGKKIYFLMQYGIILIALDELKDAIAPLTEASELCMKDAKQKNSPVDDSFRRVHIGKIHVLLGEINLRLNNVAAAKAHALISLRQYDAPMLSLTYTIPSLIVNRPCLSKMKLSKDLPGKSTKSIMHSDFGICMSLVSSIFVAEGHWELAKQTAIRGISLLRDTHTNVAVMCDVYSNAIDLYNYCGDARTCELLERCVNREILRNYTGNLTVDLYSLCKLIAILFHTKVMNGSIDKALRIGYRALDLNSLIQANFVQLQLLPVLASTLILAQRIDEGVHVSRLLYNVGKTVDPSALLAYYAFCVELYVETSFILETVDNCVLYADSYFATRDNSLVLNDMENKILVYLYVHYMRNLNWLDALKYRDKLHIRKSKCNSVISVLNLMKYTEGLLVTLVQRLDVKDKYKDLELKRIQSYMNYCKSSAKKWKIFLPRYLHLQAYLIKVKTSKVEHKVLKKALCTAEIQGNILEHCWLSQSDRTWRGGFSFENDRKNIDWKIANTYSTLQWSQILYALPYND